MQLRLPLPAPDIVIPDDPIDAYYTKPEKARECVEWLEERFDLSKYQVVEPSAGDGSFLPWLPDDTIALDLHPKAPGIIQADYLHWHPPISDRPYFVIGNPPYGRCGRLIRAFVEHSMTYAGYVAFLLPHVYSKPRKPGGSNTMLLNAHRIGSIDKSYPFDDVDWTGNYEIASFVLYQKKMGYVEPMINMKYNNFRIGSIIKHKVGMKYHGYEKNRSLPAIYIIPKRADRNIQIGGVFDNLDEVLNENANPASRYIQQKPGNSVGWRKILTGLIELKNEGNLDMLYTVGTLKHIDYHSLFRRLDALLEERK